MLSSSIEVRRGWVAVDCDGSIWWYANKPKWDRKIGMWMIAGMTDAEVLLERPHASDIDATKAKASLMRVKAGSLNVFVTQREE